MICIVFGLPGAGKTFVGKILEKDFGFYLHDGDVDLPDDMRVVLEQNAKVTDEMRNTFFQNILESISRLESEYKDIVVAQTFIKEKYREWVKDRFPKTKFILVVTPDKVREKRLIKRADLNIHYMRQMVANFDQPKIANVIVDNSVDGEEHVKEQLSGILKEFLDNISTGDNR